MSDSEHLVPSAGSCPTSRQARESFIIRPQAAFLRRALNPEGSAPNPERSAVNPEAPLCAL
eukprot:6428097-Alexandrium_andersonii.AAC.1